jgi:hypothetical protein
VRIVSNFKDYYDIGLGLGYDSHVDYIRTPREIDFSEELAPIDRVTRDFFRKEVKRSCYSYSSAQFSIGYVVIGFCGAFYPLVILSKWGAEPKFCYSYEELCSIIDDSRYKHYKTFFDTVKSLKNEELFRSNRAPILIVVYGNKTKATWNGLLRQYNFARIIDPYQAFQKIDMFLSNLAAPEKPIPPRTDLEKLQSHGFDKKVSFRKGKKDI